MTTILLHTLSRQSAAPQAWTMSWVGGKGAEFEQEVQQKSAHQRFYSLTVMEEKPRDLHHEGLTLRTARI